MHLTTQEACCFFRLALATGLMDRQSLVDWADGVLLRNPTAQTEIIELSLCGRLPYSQIIWQLNQYQAYASLEQPFRLLLAYAGLQLEAHPYQEAHIRYGLGLLTAESQLPAEIRAFVTQLAGDQAAQIFPEAQDARPPADLEALLDPYQVYRAQLEDLLAGALR